MEKVWRILSIDGGGTRGIVPAIILASIEERTGKPISQLFDLIAGTSTGGILSLGLVKPNAQGKPNYSAGDLCDLYEEQIPHIFLNPQSWWGNLLGPKYRSVAFQRILKEAFGDCMLKDALTDVLIPCYDIEHRKPYIFRSRLARDSDEQDLAMKDVALSASASPTLFYPVRLPKSIRGRAISLVDGGVFANNPSIYAWSECRSEYAKESEKHLIVSLGTGKSTRPLTDDFLLLWGYVHWSRPMLELVMESISESVHEQIKQLQLVTGDQAYYRIQVDLPETLSMAIDDASPEHMATLGEIARKFCSSGSGATTLDTLCERLLSLSCATADTP
jgi:patatin-like phospholipase/acyl hydrolase